MYDELMDDDERQNGVKNKNNRKTPLHQFHPSATLQLPKLNQREHIPEIISQQRMRERRIRKQNRQKNKQRLKSKSAPDPLDSIVTTLEGPHVCGDTIDFKVTHTRVFTYNV